MLRGRCLAGGEHHRRGGDGKGDEQRGSFHTGFLLVVELARPSGNTSRWGGESVTKRRRIGITRDLSRPWPPSAGGARQNRVISRRARER